VVGVLAAAALPQLRRLRLSGPTLAATAALSLLALVPLLFWCDHDMAFLHWGGTVLEWDIALFFVAVALGARSAFVTTLAGNRPAVILGRASLPIYIWHYPVFMFVQRHTEAHGWSWEVGTAIGLLGTFAVCVVVDRLIERPVTARLRSPRWHELDVATPTLAHWLGRGLRSGIGIHGFDHGGLLVDGGPGADGQPAPLLSRIALPGAWRIVVVQDERSRGLAGADEKAAMAALSPMPAAHAAEICHEVLMRVLPGAAGAEFDAFAHGVSRVQQLLGAHYAPAQQGRAYTSAAVGRLMHWAGTAVEPAAIGQSSWGPTGFAIVASQSRAEALVNAARAAGLIEPGLVPRIVAARNHGAEITDTRASPRAR